MKIDGASVVLVFRCARCGFEIRDDGEGEMSDCTKHPARAEGWKGSTPHELEPVASRSFESFKEAPTSGSDDFCFFVANGKITHL